MSKNTRKQASTSTKEAKIIKPAPAPIDQNIFASPWKRSDTTLVVEGTEFHVHRQILTMHSPVFDAMFGGSFKEAKEDRVELPGKKANAILQFLKLLYPQSMISTPKVVFSHVPSPKIMYSVLRIADEYQTEELLRRCLDAVVIRSENVFEILPYASKYNHNVLEACVDHVAKYVKINELKKMFTKLEAPLMQELLVAKCKRLEDRLDRVANHPKFEKHYMVTSDDESSDSTDSSESSD